MASKKNAFLLYKDQWEAISDLNDKTLGQLIRAIFEYQIEGKEPEKHDIIYRDFRYFKTHFDRDDAKYQLIVEKKKVAGAEGGKQKAAKLADASISYKSKHNLANVADNDNDNDNDLIITPTPSSPDGKEASESKKPRAGKKSKVQTTLEQAIDFYKTQSAGAVLLAPAAAESYKQLAYEICGKKTLDCPEGMVKTIMRLPEQLHFDQYQNLCKIMGGHDVLRSILLEMHNNYEQYLTKRHSINLVAQDWYKNRQKKQVNSPRPVTGSTISAPKEVIQ